MKIIRVRSVTKKFGDEKEKKCYSDTKPIGKVKSSLGSGPLHEEFNRRREAIKSLRCQLHFSELFLILEQRVAREVESKAGIVSSFFHFQMLTYASIPSLRPPETNSVLKGIAEV